MALVEDQSHTPTTGSSQNTFNVDQSQLPLLALELSKTLPGAGTVIAIRLQASGESSKEARDSMAALLGEIVNLKFADDAVTYHPPEGS